MEEKKSDNLGDTVNSVDDVDNVESGQISNVANTEEQSITTTEVTNSDGEISDVEVIEEEEAPIRIAEPTPTQKKLQILLGILSGAAIWFSLGLGYVIVEIQNGSTFFSWLFVIVFAVIMFGKRFYDNKKHVDTRVFSKFFLISLIVFLGVYILISYFNGWLFN